MAKQKFTERMRRFFCWYQRGNEGPVPKSHTPAFNQAWGNGWIQMGDEYWRLNRAGRAAFKACMGFDARKV